RTDCTLAHCGDDVVDAGEDCDGTPDCAPNCVLLGTCGDGLVDPGEDCDDGNQTNGDGCDSTCAVEVGWECPENVCTTICGDGIVTAPETCDDGNDFDWDGCTNCRIDGDDCEVPYPLDDLGATTDGTWVWSSSTATMNADFNSQPTCAQSGGRRDAVAEF